MEKIILITALYPPHVGGVERYSLNLAHTLAEKGAQVWVVTSELGYQREGEEQSGGNVTVIKTPCFPLFHGRLPIIRYNAAFRRAWEELSALDFELCVVNTRFYPLSFFGVRFAAKNQIPCILIEHGSQHLAFGKKLPDMLVELYEHGITMGIRGYCRRYYGVSEESCTWLSHFHIKASGVLHNAIDVKQVEQEQREASLHLPLLPEDARLVVYAGRLIHRKGILELNEAVRQLLKEFPNLYLLYAGDGELEKQLQEQRTDHTILLGRLPHEQIMKLLSRAEIYCLPSETEGFPTGVLEAVASHCFVVTTTAGGSKELITDKSYGIIMQDNQPETIRQALVEVLSDSSYRKAAVEKCYQRLVEEYNWECVADRVLTIASGMEEGSYESEK